MHMKSVLILSAALAASLSTSAFAARVDTAEVPHHAVHKHHVAKNATQTAAPNTATDVDRDAGMYIVKPQSDPEIFGHATGSDGSMPSE